MSVKLMDNVYALAENNQHIYIYIYILFLIFFNYYYYYFLQCRSKVWVTRVVESSTPV